MTKSKRQNPAVAEALIGGALFGLSFPFGEELYGQARRLVMGRKRNPIGIYNPHNACGLCGERITGPNHYGNCSSCGAMNVTF
jgi:hypothetical protein